MALEKGHHVIARHGERVVVAMEEHQKLTAKEENLGTFLMNSPLVDSDVRFERNKERIVQRVKL